MKLYKTYKITILSILSLFFLSSCSKESATESFENSLINVKLSSTQSNLSKLNIEVLDVQFRVLEDETNPNAWVSLNTINRGVHDLTKLNQEQVLSLVDFEEVPAGFIYNIKIVLGDQNSATRNGIEHVLDMSSEFQNASTNIIGKQLTANTLYEFIVEFEIDNCVEFSSGGIADFKPKMNTVMHRMQLH